MAISDEQRTQIIGDFKTHDKDSGSAEVQIAVLTADIKALTEHMKVHKKDYHSRRGLLQKVSRRAKLLKYMDKSAHTRYIALTEKLGLRR